MNTFSGQTSSLWNKKLLPTMHIRMCFRQLLCSGLMGFLLLLKNQLKTISLEKPTACD